MLFVKTKKKNAQKLKEFIIKNNLFDKRAGHIIEGEDKSLFYTKSYICLILIFKIKNRKDYK